MNERVTQDAVPAPATAIIAAAMLLLLTCFPFVAPWHNAPWFTYYPEWIAAALALALSGVLLFQPRPSRVGLASWWFGAFAVALVVQTAILQPGYWGPALTAASQLAACAFLTQAIVLARARWGADRVLLVLCAGLVLGGLISGAIGWIQRLNMTSNFPGLVLVHPIDPRQALGNIGQRNLYGHYQMWASIASVYLFARLPRLWLPLFGLMTWMAFEAALAESRTTLGYYAFWLMVAATAVFYRTSPLQRRFGLATLWAVGIGILMQFIGPDIVRHLAGWLGEPIQARAGLDRFADQGAGLGRRVAEWQKALMVFREHPLLGVGWGYFAGESYRLHTLPQFAAYREDVLWTHCHNSVLQILAEMGVLGLGFLLALAALLLRALRRWQSDVTMVVLPLLGVSLIHSQMEYPLWYLHYLALFAVFLALLEPAPELHNKPPAWRMPLLALAALITALHPPLFEWVQGGIFRHAGGGEQEKLHFTRRIPYFDYLSESRLARYAIAKQPSLPVLDDITLRLMNYRPFPDANFWRMCVLGQSGRVAQVQPLFLHAQITYPGYAAGFARDLTRYHCVPESIDPARWLTPVNNNE